MPILIPINYDLAKEHGVNAAIVHQQVTHYIAHEDMMRRESHEPGWFTGSAEQLTEICPITEKQIRTAMAALLAAGLMEKTKFRSRFGDQTCSYRPVEYSRKPTDSASAPQGKSGFALQGGSGDAPQGKSSSPSEKKIFSPLPPKGGVEGSGRLFATGPTPARAVESRFTEENFDAMFWLTYPAKGLGTNTRGSRSSALKAWLALGRKHKHLTPDEVAKRLGHFLAARDLAAERWGVPAPLKSASAWLNGSLGDWITPPSGPDDERVEYWAFACKQAAAAGGSSADEVGAAFATAVEAWDRARFMSGRRADNARELLTGKDPRIWEAILHCWEVLSGTASMDAKREAFTNGWAIACAGQVSA